MRPPIRYMTLFTTFGSSAHCEDDEGGFMLLSTAEYSAEDGSLLMVNPNTLSEFGKCTLALAEWLEKHPSLDINEQLFIENHILILKLAHAAWIRHERKT